MSSEEFKNIALSFPGTLSRPHFNRTAFQVEGKRIFATLLEENETANIVLTVAEQQLFCEMDKSIYPVPNKWGARGWTTFDLTRTPSHIVLEALSSAYQDV